MEVHELVARHLDQMEQVDLADQASAHVALAHAMAAVGTMNQGLVFERAATPGSLRSPANGLIERLEEWIERLLDKLTQIVKALAKGSSFSLSVGTTISVAINFPPMVEA
jgi:hypothetical protein